VTVLAGADAPIPLAEIDTHVPDGFEIETHEGGQPSWWWLLAAQ
jgi:fatty acid kinase